MDPSIDYCVRRLEFLRNLETEDVSFRMENKDYQKFNDVWYPTNIEETYYKKDGTISRHNMIKIKSALFNVDFPLDFFKIDRHYFCK